MKNLRFVIPVLAILIFCSPLAFGPEVPIVWPAIQPLKRTFEFVDKKASEARVNILGANGMPLYSLECYLNAYERNDRNFDYSGNFECRLTSLNQKDYGYSTLLTEEVHQSRDWQSRGRFLISELEGKCADYPEYGKVRHFRLRGLKLTLEIVKISIERGSSAQNQPWLVDRISDLTLIVSAVPDPKASSAIAERTEVLEPPRLHPEDPNDLSRKCEPVRVRQER